ncbi:DUF1570 domain-containing protein [Pseudobacteriovorax antillogorgiicola]|uniref:DUF1570 domain-containing protein n=1 Tax=Pseudobacteriovorax antillogorgiicola TaxID=1513793 RepID=UPI0013563238|nr:DUF1570 domain-containing protein [Pseudobacteriovorax antillogorgiicola]
MLKIPVLTLAVLLSSCVTINNRDARWYQLSSENFILYTDGSLKRGETLLQMMEGYRRTIEIFINKKLRDDLPPLRMIVPESFQKYSTLAQKRMVAGYYSRHKDGPIIVFNQIHSRNIFSLSVALHEYVHFIQYQKGYYSMPPWYREGMAEYLASVEVSKGAMKFQVGGIHETRLKELSFTGWLSAKKVLLGEKTTTDSGFYPLSWLLTHYFVNKHQDSLSQYLDDRSPASKEKFNRHFGFSIDDLDAKLFSYYRSGKFSQYEVVPNLSVTKIRVSPVEPQERDYLLVKIGLENERLSQEDIEHLLKDSKHYLADLTFAEFYFKNDQSSKALAHLQKIIKKHPEDYRIQLLMGKVLLQQFLTTDQKDAALAEKATYHLHQANKLNQDNAEIFAEFAKAGLLSKKLSATSALEALQTAIVLTPYVESYYLSEARLLSVTGAKEEAKAVLRKLVENSKDQDVVDEASDLLLRL